MVLPLYTSIAFGLLISINDDTNIIAENINTREVLEFPSKLSLAKYFEDLYCIESSSKN